VKRLQKYCLFLLVLSFLVPVQVAYLYYDYYSDIELQTRKRFSNDDEENLLFWFKKNPRVFHPPDVSLQHQLAALVELSFIQPLCFLLPDAKNFVLRC
jgi:hypothetical protein